MLKKETIIAGVLDERVDEGEAKAISITENLIRRNLHGTELIDGITFLYNMYGGSEEAVHQKTGIPMAHIRDYVKHPRLKHAPKLKQLVDDQEVDARVALRALDAANVGDSSINEEDAVKLAKEMASMSGLQRKKLVKERQENPETSVDDAIEQARTGSKIRQVIVTLTGDAHAALQRFAKEEDVSQDDAAATFIEEGLIGRGFLGK
jgi:ParB family chromosome partitioning protein